MSLQELQIRALKDQIINLTRDCHYLMSLLNTESNIDWDNWPQGQKIKEDLERSKDFFDHQQYQKKRFNEELKKENDSSSKSDVTETLLDKKIQELERFRKEKAAERKAREQFKDIVGKCPSYAAATNGERNANEERCARELFFSPIVLEKPNLDTVFNNLTNFLRYCSI